MVIGILFILGLLAILIYATRASIADRWYEFLDKIDGEVVAPPTPINPPEPTVAELAAQIDVKPSNLPKSDTGD